MPDKQAAVPDTTAVRTASWRALHVEVDAPPHVSEDEVGLQLAAPDDGWRSRPDMSRRQLPRKAWGAPQPITRRTRAKPRAGR